MRRIQACVMTLMGLVWLACASVFAQPVDQEWRVIGEAPAPPVTPDCGLRALPHDPELARLRPPLKPTPQTLKKTATITVNYFGFTPEAQAAFQRAVDTWSAYLESDRTIVIDANWGKIDTDPSDGTTLGFASPASYFFLESNAGLRITVGSALAEFLTGEDLTQSADIETSFNSEVNWHLDPGTAPGNQINFEMVVLHEIGHGLNFLSNTWNFGGACGSSGRGCYSDNPDPIGLYLADGNGRIMRNYQNESGDLGRAMTGKSRGVDFRGIRGQLMRGRPVEMHAPDTYSINSFSHVSDKLSSSADFLMTPFARAGEPSAPPGPVTCGIMADMGWTMSELCELSETPTESTDLSGIWVDAFGNDATISWNTAHEIGNAGFDVETRYGDGPYSLVASVNGAGTTTLPQRYSTSLFDLDPGKHFFRVVQRSNTGTEQITSDVEVSINAPDGFFVTDVFPNPFAGAVSFSFLTNAPEQVNVAVYNAVGVNVGTLYSGQTIGGTPIRVTFDGSGLAGGLYVALIQGENFATSRKMILVNTGS